MDKEKMREIEDREMSGIILIGQFSEN